jgi:hypothetical protein
MNIFRLDDDPIIAATMSIDRHSIKMCLETTQILHTSLRQHGFEASWMYKSFNPKHPSCLWASESRDNFKWLVAHGKALCAEYTKRYGKHHKCYPLIDRADCVSMSIPMGKETPMKLAMPDQFRTDNPVHSYRLYYAGSKFRIASWKTQIPYWWDEYRALVKKQNLEVINDKDDGVNV